MDMHVGFEVVVAGNLLLCQVCVNSKISWKFCYFLK
jgi:hypothetical protein